MAPEPETRNPPTRSEPGPWEAEKRRAIQEHLESPAASSVEKALAVASGVAEGFAEQSRAARLPEVAGDAVDKAIHTAKEVGEGSGMKAEAPAVERPAAAEVTPAERAEAKTETATEKFSLWAEAVGESAGRAAEVRAAVQYDVKRTTREVVDELKTAALGYALVAVLGLFALALVTVVVAVLLNAVFGNPWGTLIVAILYAIGAAIAYGRAKQGTENVQKTTRRGWREMKNDVRGVTTPLKRARRGGAQP